MLFTEMVREMRAFPWEELILLAAAVTAFAGWLRCSRPLADLAITAAAAVLAVISGLIP